MAANRAGGRLTEEPFADAEPLDAEERAALGYIAGMLLTARKAPPRAKRLAGFQGSPVPERRPGQIPKGCRMISDR